MTFFIISCIVAVVAVIVLFISKEIGVKRRMKVIKEQQDKVEEIILPSSSHSGLAPTNWKGKLPQKVNDFRCPRYVYENLVESEKHDTSQGQIIGYRISPTLVIHDMTAHGDWDMYDAEQFIKVNNGHLLTWNEAQVLLAHWKHVSQMRQDAGDKPLPEGLFWIEKYKQMASISPSQSKSLFANIIMRR